MEASFEIFGNLSGRRKKASSGARYESYWRIYLGFVVRM